MGSETQQGIHTKETASTISSIFLSCRKRLKETNELAEGRFIGISKGVGTGRMTLRADAEEMGFHAPLIRRGSKLRLARPDERNTRRLENPQTEWDLLHGLITAYRTGDIPVARGYLAQYAQGREEKVLRLLDVWAAKMPDEKWCKEARPWLSA